MYSPMNTAMGRLNRKRGIYSGKVFVVTMAVLTAGLCLTALNVYELRRMQDSHMAAFHGYSPDAEAQSSRLATTRPVLWLHAKRIETGYLNHVIAVFDRLGFLRGDSESEWDVLWAHDYPFAELSSHLMQLKPHQRINHYPGIGYITNKVYLATSKLDYIPLAFEMPNQKEEFLKKSKDNPDMLWVQKSNTHRGIHVKKIEDLELNTDKTFIQEFIQKPFLIDGRKFDIGIYTVIASIDPLRLYIYEEETLIRYCSKDYYPVDFDDVDKYVVGDDYTPTWKMPSLQSIYEDMSYSHKETLNIFIRQQGKDSQHIWDQMYESITQVVSHFEPKLVSSSSKYKSVRNFMELVRFDFVLDEDLKVYLMEVNMSPNLSSKHTGPNKLMYEQVIYNYLNLVGAARPVPTSVKYSTEDEKDMLVSDRDIKVSGDICVSDKCTMCHDQECRICDKCLSADQKAFLKQGFLEHVNSRSMKRLYPPAMSQEEALGYDISKDAKLSVNNQLSMLWFREKCILDIRWCS
ncbi:probable tubulin polyglutamylase ttll-15 [Ptychodera flava]|uniref:probable tubulin polyglutamylase ttll-15 n=1 Tax=Ptychodera flava TaxID=63121 RepID=UPI00396A4AC1